MLNNGCSGCLIAVMRWIDKWLPEAAKLIMNGELWLFNYGTRSCIIITQSFIVIHLT